MSASPRYWAFISYSSRDRKVGSWLRRRFESYPIPKAFHGSVLTDGTRLGSRLKPVFRDRDELTGSSELGPSITKALEQSRYLVVLCSKNSAKSRWVNKEIEDFQAMGRGKHILALILDGEPNASGNPNLSPDEECFPPALRYPNAEPIAGDLRKEGDGKERGFLKVLAGAAELNFDALYRRHERTQKQRRLIIGGVAAAIICALVGLSSFALAQKREAVEQKREAEEQKKSAVEQRDLAKRRLADSFFNTGTTRISAGEDYVGMRELASALAVDPAHANARQRLYDHLSNHNYALPVSSKLRLEAEKNYSGDLEIELLGTSPAGNLFVRQDTKIVECALDDGEIKTVESLKIEARKILSALYNEASGLLAVCWAPAGERTVGRLSLFRREDGKWTQILEEEVGGHERLLFSPDGRFLYLHNLDAQIIWEVKSGKRIVSRDFPGMRRGVGLNAGVAFSPRSRFAVLSMDDQASLIDLKAGSSFDLPFKIEALKVDVPLLFFRESDPLVLIGGNDGIRAIGIGMVPDGAPSGTFDDWGIISEPAGNLPGTVRAFSTWLALPDECLAYFLSEGKHAIIDTRRLIRGQELHHAIIRKEVGYKGATYMPPAKCRLSGDGRFVLYRHTASRVYDLQQLREVCPPLETGTAVSDLCWVGSDGKFAVLDRFGDLQFYEAEGSGLPALKGQELGFFNQPEMVSFGKMLGLEPQTYRPCPCVVIRLGGSSSSAQRLPPLSYQGLEKVSGAVFIRDGNLLAAAFVDPTQESEHDSLVIYDTNNLEAPPQVVVRAPLDEIAEIPHAGILASHYARENQIELTDTTTLKRLALLPESESVHLTGRWVDLPDDRSRAIWRINDQTIGLCPVIAGGSIGDITRHSFLEEVRFVEISPQGNWAGVVLKSGKVVLWKTDGGSEMLHFETNANAYGGIEIDERNSCLHIATTDQALASYDLTSGSLVSRMPLDFHPTKIEISRKSGVLKVSYSSAEQAPDGANWRFGCPEEVDTRDLITMTAAVTGWQWDEKRLIMRPGDRFTETTKKFHRQRVIDRRAAPLRMPREDYDGKPLDASTLGTLADEDRLVLLGKTPGGYHFRPVMRVHEALKWFNEPPPLRTEAAAHAANLLPAPTDVGGAGEALNYARLRFALADRERAAAYLSRSKELDVNQKLAPSIGSLETSLKQGSP